MTVESATASASYTGNGSTTVFPVPFYFLVDTDLKVTRLSATTGLVTTLVLNSDYTLTGAGDSSGGALTTSPALPAGDEIYIERNVAAVQETAYPNNGPFPAASHERALDRLTMLAQQTIAKLTFGLFRDPLTSTYDAGGNVIGNVADGVADTDAVSKLQMEVAVAAAAGGVLPGEIALAPDLASTAAGKGAALLGYIVDDADATAVPSTVNKRLRHLPVTPQDFGAAGDGVTDDSAAIDKVLTFAQINDRTVDWGDASKTYRITTTLIRNYASDGFRWVSSGATILFDPAAHMREAVQLTASGGTYQIDGKLVIDANRKANIGFLFQNTTDGSLSSYYGDFIATDLNVRNPYRDTTTFTGGDGIYIRGAWSKVILVRPDVRNCAMAAGAGVPGSQGIFGITVANYNSVSFKYCSIVDPFVDGVYSEDNTYVGDQDAIRIFDGGDTAGRTYPWETFFEVRGGEIRNHYGRGIKGQTNFGRVNGTKFYRDVGYSTNVGGREIDLQVGGGTITDIECLYVGTVVPESICQLADPSLSGRTVPSFSIRGVKVVSTAAQALGYGFVFAKDQVERTLIRLQDVDIKGNLTYVAQHQVLGNDCILMATDITAAPTAGFFRGTQGGGAGTTISRIMAERCVNTGASAVPFVVRSTVSANMYVTAPNCVNFTDAVNFTNSATNQPAFERTSGIAASNNVQSGIFRPYSTNSLADGASMVLPQTASSGNSGIVMVTVATGNITDQAIFLVSNAGANLVSSFSTRWTVGATSDPGAGNWRIWATAGGITIKNASGTASALTVWMFG